MCQTIAHHFSRLAPDETGLLQVGNIHLEVMLQEENLAVDNVK